MNSPLPALCLTACLFCTQLSALIVDSFDFFTEGSRINTLTREVDPLAISNPTAIYTELDDLLIRSMGSQTGRLWRYNPVTGKQTLLLESESLSAVYGQNIIAGKFLGDLFIMTGGASASSIRVLALQLNSLSTRTFEIPGLETGRPDILLTPNGRLAAIAAGGDGVLMTLGTGQLVADAGGLSGHILKGLTRTSDFRLIGVTSIGSSNDIGLVQIDLESGVLSPYATLTGIDQPDSHLRIVTSSNGDHFVSVYSSSGMSKLYRVDGDNFEVSEIPLPEGIELDPISSLKLDPNGNLLIGALDKRISIPGGARVFLRMNLSNYATGIAIGSSGLESLPLGHMTHVQDGVLHYVPAAINGLQDKVMQMELKTGAVTVVTSSAHSGSILTRARQIAVNGNNLYVIEEDPEGNAHLIRVNAVTGSQTYLTQLGEGLFIQYMIYEGRTGYLLFTTIGGHPEGGSGTVMQVWPEAGAQPEVLTDLPFTANPRGLSVAPEGDIYVCGSVNGNRVYKVNRATGEWSHLSNSTAFQRVDDLELTSAGDLLVLDSAAQAILRVNTTTGMATTFLTNVPSSTYLVKVKDATNPPPKPFALVTGAEKHDDSWYYLDWYGWFNASGNWLMHLEHGWQYFGGGDEKSLYFYDIGLRSWVWTNPTTYPLLYAFTPFDEWLLYLPGGFPDDRWFFSYQQDAWLNISELGTE